MTKGKVDIQCITRDSFLEITFARLAQIQMIGKLNNLKHLCDQENINSININKIGKDHLFPKKKYLHFTYKLLK